MHIAYLISRYPAISHTFVQREVLALRNLGWTITTISIRRPAPRDLLTNADRAEAQNTRVIVSAKILPLLAALILTPLLHPIRWCHGLRAAWRLRRPGLRGLLWTFFYFLEALLVHRICRRKKITHIHAHFANVASDVAMIAADLSGGTFSFTMHGPTEFFDLASHRLAEKAAAARLIICISDFARSQLMPLLPANHWPKLEVVHCGVDPEQFSSHPPRAAAADGPRHILCVARLAPVKGHALLLKALADLLIRGHLVQLTLIGDGPLRQDLEHLADVLGVAEQVQFLGSIGQDAIARHYHQADLFVLPSVAEGVPVVLMEAMAARCPVITTHIAGIPELIEDGVHGLLVRPGRADLLAHAIERLLVSPAVGRRMADAAALKIVHEFHLRKTTAQIAAVFEKHILSRRPRPSVDARLRAMEGRQAVAAPPPQRPAQREFIPVEGPHPRGAA